MVGVIMYTFSLVSLSFRVPRGPIPRMMTALSISGKESEYVVQGEGESIEDPRGRTLVIPVTTAGGYQGDRYPDPVTAVTKPLRWATIAGILRSIAGMAEISCRSNRENISG
jgi:hypothetical protein